MKKKIQPLIIAVCVLITTSVNAQSKDPAESAGSTGTVTFTYLGKKITHATVRAKDGNIWLQQNLGSTQVAKNQDDEAAYGDLFQWGRWDDTHQLRADPNTRNGMPEPNNPAGLDKTEPNPYYYAPLASFWDLGPTTDQWTAATPVDATATNGCDPCKALGTGWRLPTIVEWKEVLAKEFITDINGSMHSNLKLPTSGQRDIQGYLIAAEKDKGSYWSSNAANFQEGLGNYIEVRNGYVETRLAQYRGTGMSIRCIKTK